MMIPATLQDWLTAGLGAGAGGVLSFYFVKLILEFVAGRMDKREASVEVGRAQVDAAMQTLVAHLQSQIASQASQMERMAERMDSVEAELAECHRQHAATQGELAKYRGAQMGLGDAKQQAAANLAADRLQDRKVSAIVEKVRDV